MRSNHVVLIYVAAFFKQISNIIVSALNQNLVEFELKPGVRVIVYNTQLTLGKRFLVSFLLLFLIHLIFTILISFFLFPFCYYQTIR